MFFISQVYEIGSPSH